MACPALKKHKRKAMCTYSDPGKIMDLVMNLSDDTCAGLQIKLNTYLAEECEAELVLQIVVHTDRKEAYIEAIGKYALARKNKITMTSRLIEILHSQIESSEMLSSFCDNFKSLVLPYISKDGQADKTRFVVLPVFDKSFSLIVCVLRPKILEENVTNVVYECFAFTWQIVKKSVAFEYEHNLKLKCQQLLKVARRLFTQVASLDKLLLIAMEQAKSLVKAEHCCVKMVDVDRMQLVETFSPTKIKVNAEQCDQRRFPLDKGIAGYVLKTGEVVNTYDVKNHPAYDEEADSIPGVNSRAILCFPIREQNGIIGVGELINKIGDPYFDSVDEEMTLAFSIYCGVCIMHSIVYKKIQEAHIRNALANELVMYHMKVTEDEVSRVLNCTGYHDHPHLTALHFNPRALPVKEFPCYVFRMFKDLGFIEKFDLKPAKLASFILHARKGYRDVPYHSWMHAFSVTQWAYAAMITFKLIPKGYFSDLQGLIYLLACLVHDMDHRGTTNSFQLQGQTTLAALYSSEGSVMERHHLSQAMCLLNTEGCDVLETLPRRDYDRALILLHDIIIASDLANFFKNLKDYQLIAQDFQMGNKVHNAALQSLLMNCADLSDQLKDWGCVKKTAAAVLTEFFKQGDMEKSSGAMPLDMMDRDKCFIPELEIQFLTSICIPLFETVGKIVPNAQPCTKIIENHIERWEAAKPVFAEVPMSAGLSVLLSPDLDDLIQASVERERVRLEEEARKAEEDAL